MRTRDIFNEKKAALNYIKNNHYDLENASAHFSEKESKRKCLMSLQDFFSFLFEEANSKRFTKENPSRWK